MKLFATGERADLLSPFSQFGPDVLEIGVGNSEFSRLILERLPDSRLTAIDPFLDTSGAIEGFYDHELHRRSAEVLASEFGPRGRYSLITGTSPEGLQRYPSDSFDWIFVDGDHTFDGAREDLDVSRRLVRSAGIIACHDFAVHELARANKQEVVEAVMDFMASSSVYLYGVDLSVYPTAILINAATPEAIGKLDAALGAFVLHDFREKPTAENLNFTQSITVESGTFTVEHSMSVGNETVCVLTKSRRIFSGYYKTINTKKSPTE